MSDVQRIHPMVELKAQLDTRAPEFAAALPAHIPVERFMRVILTAIQLNPDLMKCNRRSLWNAAMKAAQDGLLPDGRDGAIVPYKDEAQWLPMVAGIRKKARNSGEIATWDVHAVYENDEFEFELGDEPFIRHKPSLADRGKIIAVYSIATLKSGEKSRDVMSIQEVEKIRAISRAKSGPWSNPTFYPEMAKKTVARRHAKVLPTSTDLDDLIRRDDHLYELDGAKEAARIENGGRPVSLAGRLSALVNAPAQTIEHEQNPSAEGSPADEGAAAQANPPATAAAPEPDDDFPGDRK